MAEYIEREAALNADFKTSVKRLDTRIKTARDAVQAYANYIAGLPAADVQPVVHGHWIKDSDGFPICSECREIALQRMITKVPSLTTTCRLVESDYCPNCGARMDEDG